MKTLKSIYHYLLAVLGAVFYDFPSRQIYVIAITGTKGKSSTAELVSAILEAAGAKTAICSTIRFKIGDESKNNLKKMTMPGRAFIQKFLHQAVRAKCDYAIVEMTSQGVLQYRHLFIDMNALIFTNLSPEHIESHGSYENYVKAKLQIGHALELSPKLSKVLVVNGDDDESFKFLALDIPTKVSFHLASAPNYITNTKLVGQFNKYNLLAAATFAKTQGVGDEIIEKAFANVDIIRGRMERVGGKDFDVIVDYAHTADSLEKVYQALSSSTLHPSPSKLICVLGGTGGGRDHWKRPVMGKIAATHCTRIFLTDEDPYDENPREIVDQIAAVIPPEKYEIEMDRRVAIRNAIAFASTLRQAQGDNNVVVIITGKGTDPCIMGPNGTQTPWSDAEVARDELAKAGKS